MTLDLLSLLPAGWRERIEPHLDPATTASLAEFVAAEYANAVCYPPLEDLFTAFRLCPPEEARVLILGQDPYHKAGQAHGLSFSVRPGVPVPPSLRNVYKELRQDLGVEPPPNGDLTGWAAQGVLLLNAVLTVREAKPGSHANKGWEHFTDAAITALNELENRVVFVLWGGYARKKAELIDRERHTIIESAHPSPLSARNGFFGSRPFSKINAALRAAKKPEIDWQLPEL